jgi:uncharacterized repeat protein (TIGR02543 family)
MTKTGYVFDKWYTDPDKTTQAVFPVIVTGSVNLYAKWNPVTYTVRYDKNAANAGGTTVDSVHTYDVEKALSDSGYTRAGYAFAGWNTNVAGTGTNYADGQSVINLATTGGVTITLYARWDDGYFTVSYIANGSLKVPEDQIVIEGRTVDRPDNPVMAGYSFDGWYKEGLTYRWNFSSDTVLKDEVLYGKWNGPLSGQCNVRFIRGGGIPFPEDIAVNAGAKLSGVPDISRPGYAFGGWFRDSACAEEPWLFDDDTVVSDITLYAKWNESNYYTINFITNGGTPVPQQVVALNGFVDNVTTTKPNYTVAGWYEESALVREWDIATFQITGNLNLYAKWTANTLSIGYANGGGTGSAPVSPVSAAYGTTVTRQDDV